MTKEKETSSDLLKRMRDMELHDTIDVTSVLEIMRVPGGWNYGYMSTNMSVTVVFVPLCNDFKQAK